MIADETRPTHIIDQPADKRTRCGAEAYKPAGLPHVWAPYVQAHIDGRGMTVCPQCAIGGWPTQ